MPTKTNGPLTDATLASMALAGIRVLSQSSVSPATTAAATYTVAGHETRRLMVITLGDTTAGAAAGDIRFKTGGTATAAEMPLIPQRYATFYLVKDETISFYNTAANTVAVYVAEIE